MTARQLAPAKTTGTGLSFSHVRRHRQVLSGVLGLLLCHRQDCGCQSAGVLCRTLHSSGGDDRRNDLFRPSSRATQLQAGAAGFLFALSGPVIENFYTLSKAEPIQVFLLVCSLILAGHCDREASLKRQVILALGIAGLLLLANATKETSLVMIPISAILLAVALVRKRWRAEASAPISSPARAREHLPGAVFLFLRKHFATSPISSGSYTKAYSFANVGDAVGRLTGWVIRDFPQLLPFGVVAALLLMQRKSSQDRLLLLSAIWMLFWIGVFAPWHSSLEYYLLPFAVGAALFMGLVFGECVAAFRQPGRQALKTSRHMPGNGRLADAVHSREQRHQCADAIDRGSGELQAGELSRQAACG